MKKRKPGGAVNYRKQIAMKGANKAGKKSGKRKGNSKRY